MSNVLLIPGCCFNLILVSKLCEFSKNINFCGSQCFIHNNTSLRKSGSAERINELYYLTLEYKDVHTPDTSSLDITILSNKFLWNFRLYHLSHSRISYLHSKVSFILVDNKDVCDVCHYARQRKFSYTISTIENFLILLALIEL